jgi:hypothetical protein
MISKCNRFDAVRRSKSRETPAEVDRGRHLGFPGVNFFAGGPGNLAER